MWFLALVSLTDVKGRSVCQEVAKTRGTVPDLLDPFLIKSRLTIDQQNHQKNDDPKNTEFDTKGMPTWIQHRCPISSKIIAKTGNEKDHENHQQSCFPEW